MKTSLFSILISASVPFLCRYTSGSKSCAFSGRMIFVEGVIAGVGGITDGAGVIVWVGFGVIVGRMISVGESIIAVGLTICVDGGVEDLHDTINKHSNIYAKS